MNQVSGMKGRERRYKKKKRKEELTKLCFGSVEAQNKPVAFPEG